MDIVVNNPDLLKIILSFVPSSRQVFLFRRVSKLWKSICEKTAVWFRLAPIYAIKHTDHETPYSTIEQPFFPTLQFFYSHSRTGLLSEKIITVGQSFPSSKRIEFAPQNENPSKISDPAEARVLKIFSRVHDHQKLKHIDTVHEDIVTPGILHLQKEGLLSLDAWTELGKFLFIIFFVSSHGEDKANPTDVKIPEVFPSFDSPALNDNTSPPILSKTNDQIIFQSLHFVDWGSGYRSPGGYRRRLYSTEIRLIDSVIHMKSTFKIGCEELARGVLSK